MGFFSNLLNKKRNLAADRLYVAASQQSQSPWFYGELGVPDSPLGRFEILTLHLFLLMRRLKEEGTKRAQEVSQELCDTLVVDMDHSLRNVKVSESKIEKQFKKFMEGFYGRLVAYDEGLERDLDQVLHRNVYDGVGNLAHAQKLSHYLLTQLATLRATTIDQLQFKEIDTQDIIKDTK